MLEYEEKYAKRRYKEMVSCYLEIKNINGEVFLGLVCEERYFRGCFFMGLN